MNIIINNIKKMASKRTVANKSAPVKGVNVKKNVSKVDSPATTTTTTTTATSTTVVATSTTSATTLKTKVPRVVANTKKTVTKKEKKTKTSDNKAQTSRLKLSDQADVSLSTSRVRQYALNHGVNKSQEAAVKELKEYMKNKKENPKNVKPLSKETLSLVESSYNGVFESRKKRAQVKLNNLRKDKTKDTKEAEAKLTKLLQRTNTDEEKLEMLLKSKSRFSKVATVSLTVALNYVVEELARCAMVNAVSKKKAIIQPEHLNDCDTFKSNSVYHLLKDLNCVNKLMNSPKEEVKSEDVNETNDGEKKESKSVSKKTAPFEFYTKLACDSVRDALVAQDKKYESVRVSREFKLFCSDAVLELIENFTKRVKLCNSYTKTKTVEDSTVRFVFEFMLVDSDSTELFAYLDSKLSTYHKNLESSKKSK